MESLTADDPRAIGEFRLLARLGAGGMGQVYLAASPAGRVVAIKIIHAELACDPKYVSRFQGEVAAAQLVSGLYTAPVVAAGVDGSLLWLATEYVPGPPLEDFVVQHGPLPVPALWRLAAGLAEALMAIHSAGLVHRDLKPENVLLALDGPRVIDFGIARAETDPRLTMTGMIMGTPAYMSPEQVQGEPGGPPGDVFSLGCVLAFASAGTAAFGTPSMPPAKVFDKVVHGEPDLSAVPAEARRLIDACLSKDPQQRPHPGQVAALGARQSEYLGLSPATFWPAGVAQVIQTQQEAVAARIRVLLATSPLPLRTDSRAGSGPVPPPAPGLSARAGAGIASSPAYPAAASLPGGLDAVASGAPPGGNGASAPRTQQPSAVRRRPADGRHAASKPGGLSRRELLIGAGIAGAAAAGGLAAWKLTTGSAP